MNMLFAYSLLAVIFYSLHNALVAPLYRQLQDKLAIVFYRGISIAVSCSPALLLVSEREFSAVTQSIPALAAASMLAVIGTWSAANSVNYLAVGTANSLLLAFSNILVFLASALVLGEITSLLQSLIIFAVLACVMILGLGQAHGSVPESYNPVKGILFCLGFGIFTGSAQVLIGIGSRESSPVLIGYLWEASIGICAGFFLIARAIIRRRLGMPQSSIAISWRTFISMLLRSSPSGAGTVCFALAMSHGSIAVASAVLNLSMVTTTLLAVFMFRERLSRLQWLLLILICVLLISLRFAE